MQCSFVSADKTFVTLKLKFQKVSCRHSIVFVQLQDSMDGTEGVHKRLGN